MFLADFIVCFRWFCDNQLILTSRSEGEGELRGGFTTLCDVTHSKFSLLAPTQRKCFSCDIASFIQVRQIYRTSGEPCALQKSKSVEKHVIKFVRLGVKLWKCRQIVKEFPKGKWTPNVLWWSITKEKSNLLQVIFYL